MARGRLRVAAVVAVAVAMVGVGGAYGMNQFLGDDDPPSAPADAAPVPAGGPAVEDSPAAVEPSIPDVRHTAGGAVARAVTVVEEEPPEPEWLYTHDDTGDDVRELQARLKQIQWYVGDVTGEYDDVTAEAVSGFQEKRGLEPTGSVDRETWDRLVDMTSEPTDDELHNRVPPILQAGDTGDHVRELQARLKQIGWFDGDITPNYGDVTRQAVAGFQEKRGLPATGAVDQTTWDRLAATNREPTDDEKHNREPEPDEDASDDDKIPASLDPRCTTGRALCIDKTTRTLRWVIDGQEKMKLDVRFGSELTPTREGAFSVGWKSRDHVSSLYDTPMPYAMFFSGGQAVHYSPDFAQNGYNGASHGCVNVRDKAAIASLFDQVNVGDKVIVYRS